MDVHEFVHVEGEEPVRIAHGGVLVHGFERRELDAALAIRAVVSDVVHRHHLGQSVEHRIGPVLAVI